MSYRISIGLLCIAAFISRESLAQTSHGIEANARAVLADSCEHYSHLPAYATEVEVILQAKSNGTVRSARQTTSFQFVRPNKIAADFGTSAVCCDGTTMKVYNTIHRTFISLPAPQQLVIVDRTPTADTHALKGLYGAMFKDIDEVNRPVESDAKALGGRLVRIILIMLLDKSPVEEIAHGTSAITLVQNEKGPTIKLKYEGGESVSLQVDPDSKQIVRMTLVLAQKDVVALSESIGGLEKVEVSCELKNAVTDTESVTKLLNKNILKFDGDFKEFRSLAVMAGPGERAPVPTPEDGPSLIELIKRWLSIVWAR